MKLINKEQVSHILVFNKKEGAVSAWGRFKKHVWMEADYSKFLWFIKTSILNYAPGFYEDKKRAYISNDTPLELDPKKHFVLNNSVWTKPHIDIYVGKDLIHTEYFENYPEMSRHLSDKYPNVNIKYE